MFSNSADTTTNEEAVKMTAVIGNFTLSAITLNDLLTYEGYYEGATFALCLAMDNQIDLLQKFLEEDPERYKTLDINVMLENPNHPNVGLTLAKVLIEQRPKLFKKIIQKNPNVFDLNRKYKLAYAGYTNALLLACNEQFDLLEELLEANPDYYKTLDLNACPEGLDDPNRGVTLACLLEGGNPKLLRKILRRNSKISINLNAAITAVPTDINKGITLAMLSLDLLGTYIKINPECCQTLNLNARFAHPAAINYGLTLAGRIATEKPELLLEIIQQNPQIPIDLNASSLKSDKGINVAWALLAHDRVDILEAILEANPSHYQTIDLNAKCHGITVAYQLAITKPALLVKILNCNAAACKTLKLTEEIKLTGLTVATAINQLPLKEFEEIKALLKENFNVKLLEQTKSSSFSTKIHAKFRPTSTLASTFTSETMNRQKPAVIDRQTKPVVQTQVPPKPGKKKKRQKKKISNTQVLPAAGVDEPSDEKKIAPISLQKQIESIERKFNLVCLTATTYGSQAKTNIDAEKPAWIKKFYVLKTFDKVTPDFEAKYEELMDELNTAHRVIDNLQLVTQRFSRKELEEEKINKKSRKVKSLEERPKQQVAAEKGIKKDKTPKAPAKEVIPKSTDIIRDRLHGVQLPQEQRFDTLAENKQLTDIREKSSTLQIDYAEAAVAERKSRKSKVSLPKLQVPIVFTPTWPTYDEKLRQSKSLECAFTHLERLGVIYIQANSLTTSQTAQADIIHFALLHHITRIFVALRIYKNAKGYTPDSLNEELIIDMRNLYTHRRPGSWSPQTVLTIAKELIAQLPQDMLTSMRQSSSPTKLAHDKINISAIMNLFDLNSSEMHSAAKNKREEKQVYPQNNELYRAEAQKDQVHVQNNEVDQALQVFNQVREQIIPKINSIMSDEHLGKEGELLFTEDLKVLKKIAENYVLEIDALKALLADAGRLYSEERAQLYLKREGEAAGEDEESLGKFMKACRYEIRNREDHDLEGCELKEVLKLCHYANELMRQYEPISLSAQNPIPGLCQFGTFRPPSPAIRDQGLLPNPGLVSSNTL